MKFKVQRIVGDESFYTHRVEFWCSKEELLPVARWIKDRAIPCSWAGYTLYMREQEMNMFMLRWSDHYVVEI